jgi:hypothetical protein
MKDVFISTGNFHRCEELYNWLLGEQYGVELGAVLGRAGRGKTTAARRIYSMNGHATYVRFEEWLTHIGLLREITFATAGVRPKSTQACFDLLEKELAGPGKKIVLLDEADRMGIRHFNAMRDLHDVFQVPIIFIGEEPLEAKLFQERRIKSRIRDVLKFEEIGQIDVVVFYKEALEVAVRPQAAARLARHAQGDFRLVVKDALAIEHMMKVSGIGELTDAIVDEVCKG